MSKGNSNRNTPSVAAPSVAPTNPQKQPLELMDRKTILNNVRVEKSRARRDEWVQNME